VCAGACAGSAGLIFEQCVDVGLGFGGVAEGSWELDASDLEAASDVDAVGVYGDGDGVLQGCESGVTESGEAFFVGVEEAYEPWFVLCDGVGEGEVFGVDDVVSELCHLWRGECPGWFIEACEGEGVVGEEAVCSVVVDVCWLGVCDELESVALCRCVEDDGAGFCEIAGESDEDVAGVREDDEAGACGAGGCDGVCLGVASEEASCLCAELLVVFAVGVGGVHAGLWALMWRGSRRGWGCRRECVRFGLVCKRQRSRRVGRLRACV